MISFQFNEESPLNNRLALQDSNGDATDTVYQVPNEFVKAEKPLQYPFWRSVRFLVVTLLGFLGTVNLFALRVNLSISLPCMVFINDSKNEIYVHSNSTISTNTSFSTGCVRPQPQNTTAPTNVRPIHLPFIVYSSWIKFTILNCI